MTVLRVGALSVRVHHRTVLAAAACLVVLVAVCAWTIATGTFSLGLDRIVATLAGNGDAGEQFIVWRVRLPRLATGLAVGAALGLAGAIFQSLTRNPLGSPDILGLTQGASTGALIAIVYGAGASVTAVTGAAAIGALAAGAAIALFSRGGDTSGYRIVLVGIAVSAILAGVNGHLLTRADIIDAARAVYWLTGDLNGRDWNQAATVGVVLAAGAVTALVMSRGLEASRLGDAVAIGLGADTTRTAAVGIATASVLTAGAVAVAGPLAFVALAAPHIAQRLTRAPRVSLLTAGITGALIVAAADAAATAGIGGRQLPTGVVTGLFGGLYLMWLLVAQRRRGAMQ